MNVRTITSGRRPADVLAFVLAGALLTTPAVLAAQQQTETPKLAAGVQPQAGYEPVPGRLVLARPVDIQSDIVWTSPKTGELDRVGEPVTALAKVKDWDYVLVGRDGVGIGYAPLNRFTVTPAGKAR